MTRRIGQSLIEYGIIACLVAVVALPALVLLSGNVNNLMTGILADPDETQLASANNNTGNNNGNNNNANNSNASNANSGNSSSSGNNGNNPYAAVFNPATGQFTLPVVEANGGGTSTSSVTGTEVTAQASQYLIQLADDWSQATGKPVPNDLRAKIMELGQKGLEMAEMEAVLLGDPAYQNPAYQTLSQRGMTFAQLYNGAYMDIAAQYKNDPHYVDLLNLVDSYTGVIASVAKNNYLCDLNGHRETMDRLAQVGTSVDTSGWSMYSGQTATVDSSNQLMQSGSNP